MGTFLGAAIVVAFFLLVIALRRDRDRPLQPGLDPRSASVEDLVAAGRKIDAIKRYRAIHRVGLREAKQAVDAMGRGLPRP